MDKTMESRLVNEIMDAVNTIGFKPNVFADMMCRQHRTLQQSAFRAFLEWTRVLAESKNYDGRNEGSVLLARELVKTMDAHGDALSLI